MTWTILGIALVVAIVACGAVALRTPAASVVVALEAASTLGVLALLVLALMQGPSYLFDTATVFAVLSFAGSLVCLHYMDAL